MYNKALTQEQSDFAAEHHNLIFAFLNKKGYPEDEYYDIAAFGYLSAVRSYFAREDLRNYAFSTIAFSRMRSYVGRHMKQDAERTSRLVSYDEYENIVFDDTSPELAYIKRECTESIEKTLTPSQKLALHLMSKGTTLNDLSDESGVTRGDLVGEIINISGFAPALYEAIAA